MPRAKKKVLPVTTREKIIYYHTEMKELCIEAGIQEPKYNYVIKKLDKCSEEYCEALLVWLENFRDEEYKAVKIMWDKMSAHGWRNLKTLLDVHDLPEQKILNGKFKLLRETFITWPRPVKKVKIRSDGKTNF